MAVPATLPDMAASAGRAPAPRRALSRGRPDHPRPAASLFDFPGGVQTPPPGLFSRAWEDMQRRALIAPHGEKRRRERELKDFTKQMLILGL